jgi:uncharacterized membrane protein
MTPYEWKTTRRFLVGIQVVVLVILAFFVLAIFGSAEQKREEMNRLRAEQRRADENVDRIVRSITEVRSRVDAIQEQYRMSLEDRGRLHEAQGSLREAVKRLEGHKP